MKLQAVPQDRIMSLPDHVFGRRWPVMCSLVGANGVSQFAMSNAGLPNNVVIWEVLLLSGGVAASYFELEIRIGNQLPTTDAEFYQLEEVFNNVNDFDNDNTSMVMFADDSYILSRLKVPVALQGRRFIFRQVQHSSAVYRSTFGVVISGFPTEVGECYRSQLE